MILFCQYCVLQNISDYATLKRLLNQINYKVLMFEFPDQPFFFFGNKHHSYSDQWKYAVKILSCSINELTNYSKTCPLLGQILSAKGRSYGNRSGNRQSQPPKPGALPLGSRTPLQRASSSTTLPLCNDFSSLCFLFYISGYLQVQNSTYLTQLTL